MHIKVLHGDKATEIDAGSGLAAAIAAIICSESEMDVAPAKPFNILSAGKIIGDDVGPELTAAIAAVICGEMVVAPAKPFMLLSSAKIAETDVGPRFVAAVTTAIYSYLEDYAPSYQIGRIKITGIQPAAVVAQSNWQLAGRISLLDSRSNFLKMRRR